jgi:hypothetical protein
MSDFVTMAMAILRSGSGPQEGRPTSVQGYALFQSHTDRLRSYAHEWVVASREGGAWPTPPDDAQARIDRELISLAYAGFEPEIEAKRLQTKLATIRQNMMAAQAAQNIPNGSANPVRPHLVSDDTGTIAARPEALPPPSAQPPQSNPARKPQDFVDGNVEPLRRRQRGDGPPGSRVGNLTPMPSRTIPRRGKGPHWIRGGQSGERNRRQTPSDS